MWMSEGRKKNNEGQNIFNLFTHFNDCETLSFNIYTLFICCQSLSKLIPVLEFLDIHILNDELQNNLRQKHATYMKYIIFVI